MRSLRWAAMGCLLALLFSLAPALALAQSSRAQSPEEKTAKYLEAVRHQPGLLLAFLQQMPKGGDLHVHLGGAIYAESMIDWASESALCVDRSTSKLISPALRFVRAVQEQAVGALRLSGPHPLRPTGGRLVDAQLASRGGIGSRPFLCYVRKVRSSVWRSHVGDALAEVASRAAADHLQYVELMHTADGRRPAILGKQELDGMTTSASFATNCWLAEWRTLWRRSAANLTPMKLARKKCCIAGRRRLLRDARLRSAICTRCCGACRGSRFSRRFCWVSS